MLCRMIDRLMARQGRRYIELALQRSPPVGLDEYLKFTALRQGIQRDWAMFFRDYPLLLGPVFGEHAVPVGFDVLGPAERALVNQAMRLCVAGTVAGSPSVTVPVGVVHGLPQSIQLLAAPYREDLCLDAALEIERRLGTLTPIDPRR